MTRVSRYFGYSYSTHRKSKVAEITMSQKTYQPVEKVLSKLISKKRHVVS